MLKRGLAPDQPFAPSVGGAGGPARPRHDHEVGGVTHSYTFFHKHDLITYLTKRYVIRYVIKCEKTRFSTLLHSQSPMGNDKPFYAFYYTLLHIFTYIVTHNNNV